MKAVAVAAAMLIAVGSTSAAAEALKVGLDEAAVLHLDVAVSVIVVGNPVVADVIVDSPKRLFLTGLAPGKTNLLIFDRSGEPIADYDLEVISERVLVKAGPGQASADSAQSDPRDETAAALTVERHGG